ncbi:hypothetical protein IHE45_04G066600 [Dioscorea alata]|uniref:Uncharacterized protein n=1 Tax=Dioscorea alata TaxID=55571 RepID=A0ACB7WCL9_DIOAL|nr:hypothetical protein IHE45_04G066600 [Dioscorea alata]
MPRLAPLLIVLLCLTTSGQAEVIKHGAETSNLVNKNHARKLMVEISLDYDYGGANNKHDPKKGKPGNGGKNP